MQTIYVFSFRILDHCSIFLIQYLYQNNASEYIGDEASSDPRLILQLHSHTVFYFRHCGISLFWPSMIQSRLVHFLLSQWIICWSSWNVCPTNLRLSFLKVLLKSTCPIGTGTGTCDSEVVINYPDTIFMQVAICIQYSIIDSDISKTINLITILSLY